MNSDGTNRVRLCEGTYPAWSPDGSKIATISYHEGFGSVYPIQLSGMKRLVDVRYERMAPPEWSPDGSQLAYVGTRDGVSELTIISVKGAHEFLRIRLTSRGRSGRIGALPAWSPDGKRLVIFIKDANDADRLHVVNPYTDDEPSLLKGQEGTFFNSDPAWSPDGTKILFATDRKT